LGADANKTKTGVVAGTCGPIESIATSKHETITTTHLAASDYDDSIVHKCIGGDLGPDLSDNPSPARRPQDSEAGSAARAGVDDSVIMGAVHPASPASVVSDVPVVASPQSHLASHHHRVKTVPHRCRPSAARRRRHLTRCWTTTWFSS